MKEAFNKFVEAMTGGSKDSQDISITVNSVKLPSDFHSKHEFVPPTDENCRTYLNKVGKSLLRVTEAMEKMSDAEKSENKEVLKKLKEHTSSLKQFTSHSQEDNMRAMKSHLGYKIGGSSLNFHIDQIEELLGKVQKQNLQNGSHVDSLQNQGTPKGRSI